MIVTKPIDLPRLEQELATAGVAVVNGLGLHGDELYTFDADGEAEDLPPDAQPVVDAHVAPPRVVEFSADQPLEGLVRTADATPTQVVRVTLALQTGYTGQVSVIGVDAANGAVRVIRASFAVKRLNAGALAVGGAVVLASHADAQATAWTVAMSVQGNDVLVTVTGAAGRTIDWLCRGQMMSFTPGGLS